MDDPIFQQPLDVAEACDGGRWAGQQEAGREPLLDTDARDLAAVLLVPEAWLRRGWDDGAT